MPAQQSTPGKATQVGRSSGEIAMPPATVTGDPLADKATAAGISANNNDPNVFLDDAQRRQIIADGAGRWLACEQRCQTALAMVRTKALIQPSDPLPFFLVVLIRQRRLASLRARPASSKRPTNAARSSLKTPRSGVH